MSIETVRQYIAEDNLDVAVKVSDILSPLNRIKILYEIVDLYEKKALFQKCLDLGNELVNYSTNLEINIGILAGMVAKSIGYLRYFDYENLEKILNEIELFINNLHDVSDRNYYSKLKSDYLNVKGLFFRFQGEFNDALNTYLESLDIRKSLYLNLDIAKSLSNISTIYQLKGDLSLALEYSLEAIQIFMEIGDQNLIGYSLHEIGVIYKQKNDLNLAEDYFLKSLDIRKYKQNKENQGETLYELIHLLLENGDTKKTKIYLEELGNIKDKSKIIDIRYNISRASIMKNSNRFVNKAEAQKIFQSIAYDQIINHDLTIFALINLSELMLYEYRMIKNQSILDDTKKITLKLQEIAKSQKSYILLVKTYLIQYQISLFKLNMKEAQDLLTQAEMTVLEHGLKNIEYYIVKEKKLLNSKIKKITEYKDTDTEKIFDDLEFTHIFNKRSNNDRILYTYDKPIFVLLLNKDGVSLYSQKFDEGIVINKSLIAGFLMASDLGIANAIDSKYGSIQSIKYGDYTLIFQPMENITGVYAFLGPFHLAIQNLNLFLNMIKTNKTLWELLNGRLIRPKIIDGYIDNIINDVFSIDRT